MYDDWFYRLIRDGATESANAAVPLIADLLALQPGDRVVDVGCGEGWWAAAFAAAGADVCGIDSARPPGCALTQQQFLAADLTQPLPALTGDLTVCLEVGEHLPHERAETFVAELCRIAPTVLWSAAVPGQGGHGHINEQWPDYWVPMFEANGMSVSGALRWMLWDNDRIEPWYRQNLLVAARNPFAVPLLFNTPTAAPWPVVHPALFTARTAA